MSWKDWEESHISLKKKRKEKRKEKQKAGLPYLNDSWFENSISITPYHRFHTNYSQEESSCFPRHEELFTKISHLCSHGIAPSLRFNNAGKQARQRYQLRMPANIWMRQTGIAASLFQVIAGTHVHLNILPISPKFKFAWVAWIFPCKSIWTHPDHR